GAAEPACGQLRHRGTARRGGGLQRAFRPAGQGARGVAALPAHRHARHRGRLGHDRSGGVRTMTGDDSDRWNGPDAAALRRTVSGFMAREVLPYQEEWERAGELPRTLHRKAGDLGLLGASFPESAGGGGGSPRDAVIICEQMHYDGCSGGLFASLFTCGIAVPHLVSAGDPRQIDRWVRPTLAGETIGSLAIT